MAGNRFPSLNDSTLLATSAHFSIYSVVENGYTHFIQIRRSENAEIIQTVPLDPTDNTLAGSLDFNLPAAEKEEVLQLLSTALPQPIGGKEFIVVREDITLPGFLAPEECEAFSRLRYCDTATLQEHTDRLIQQYEQTCNEDPFRCRLPAKDDCQFLKTEAELLNQNTLKNLYSTIHSHLENTGFTDAKLQEYQEEELQGKRTRFKNRFIQPFVIRDHNKGIRGMIRILNMGNDFAYLSDEFVTFQHDKNQLAFLMNQLCKNGLINQKHLFIIAAKGREEIYESLGFRTVPQHIGNWKLVVKPGYPGPHLTDRKNRVKQLPFVTHIDQLYQFLQSDDKVRTIPLEWLRLPEFEQAVDENGAALYNRYYGTTRNAETDAKTAFLNELKYRAVCELYQQADDTERRNYHSYTSLEILPLLKEILTSSPNHLLAAEFLHFYLRQLLLSNIQQMNDETVDSEIQEIVDLAKKTERYYPVIANYRLAHFYLALKAMQQPFHQSHANRAERYFKEAAKILTLAPQNSCPTDDNIQHILAPSTGHFAYPALPLHVIQHTLQNATKTMQDPKNTATPTEQPQTIQQLLAQPRPLGGIIQGITTTPPQTTKPIEINPSFRM